MAQIGQFTRDKSGFTGRIQTLFFTQDLSPDPRQPLPVGRRQVRLGAELEPPAEARRSGLIGCGARFFCSPA